ncbi:hypothetical protein [Chitinophaga sp. S165]|uniref:hypothetical protein n=1 Tax=Chitinophaga sp. S165 TaxID=2135462 RepID=UPI000D93930F|nr:hypothetical protein [Chitinophaga sp. S165]PWV47726.1 hypothetical protein C7475_108294 [Chitinophaga sp. S165]
MKRNLFSYLAAIPTIFNMKRTVLAVATVLYSLSAIATPGDALLRQFNLAFPDAQYIRWTASEAYHIVSFIRNNTQCRIWYDQKGTLVYSLRYCQEDELPLPVLAAVKKRYHDKHIEGVTEVTNQQGTTYELALSDAKKWYVISVTDRGNISPKNAFRKQE